MQTGVNKFNDLPAYLSAYGAELPTPRSLALRRATAQINRSFLNPVFS
jgi:hypothetical protein